MVFEISTEGLSLCWLSGISPAATDSQCLDCCCAWRIVWWRSLEPVSAQFCIALLEEERLARKRVLTTESLYEEK